MVMAVLDKQNINSNGVAPTFSVASSTGDEFKNDENTFLHVKNGGAASITVTINSQQLCNHGSTHNLSISIPAGGERMIGPFNRTRFNNDTGNVEVGYSDVTSVTVAAISI
jgi:hypothetical protein